MNLMEGLVDTKAKDIVSPPISWAQLDILERVHFS